MNRVCTDFIYLLSCAVNGIAPDTARIQSMDMEPLYQLANRHSVPGVIFIALNSAGLKEPHFHQAYQNIVRKNIFLDLERAAIFADFEQQGIWYMPLKGAVLKDLYPETGMRQMADIDVLYDAAKQVQSKEIMLAHGYTVKQFGETNHDIYHKPPVLNFELHTALFNPEHAARMSQYYADVQRLLRKDEDSEYGYHFSDEDFYVYITAHEWKHYNRRGTGIRSLLDCYVYCKIKGDALDWTYITEQCSQMEIADFEQARRQLALKIFSSDAISRLTESEQEMLMYYLSAGTFGTVEKGIKDYLKNRSKLSFWLRKVFPTRSQMAIYFPIVKKCILLYPIGMVWHFLRAVTIRRDRFRKTIAAVKKYGKQTSDSGKNRI